MTGGCIWLLGCAIKWPLHSTSTTTREMGKSQSKLSPEQLSDLQKNTYCESSQPDPLVLSHQLTPSQLINASFSNGKPIPQDPSPSSHKNCATGTRASSRIVPLANSTRLSSAGYTNSSSRSATRANLPTMYSTSSTRTRTAQSTLKNSSAH